MEFTYSIEDINTVAATIVKQNPNKVILFEGEMGVGKTTLIKSIARELGVVGNASSPTFSLVNEYQTSDKKIIYHFDFYRIKTETEALDMGVEEYLYSDNWCFIEWAEKIPNLVPEKHSKICISSDLSGKRFLKFTNF
jgi:tRNA threonylcarbamoyladenosine biosynthesis protein TsaE